MNQLITHTQPLGGERQNDCVYVQRGETDPDGKKHQAGPFVVDEARPPQPRKRSAEKAFCKNPSFSNRLVACLHLCVWIYFSQVWNSSTAVC